VVPVRRVVLIALLAVKISMHPRTLDAFVLLGGFVRSVPIALGIPPQSGKGMRESRGRFGRGERTAKIVQGHVEYSGTRWSDAAFLILSPLATFRIQGLRRVMWKKYSALSFQYSSNFCPLLGVI